jgi:hypothetical protein
MKKEISFSNTQVSYSLPKCGSHLLEDVLHQMPLGSSNEKYSRELVHAIRLLCMSCLGNTTGYDEQQKERMI